MREDLSDLYLTRILRYPKSESSLPLINGGVFLSARIESNFNCKKRGNTQAKSNWRLKKITQAVKTTPHINLGKGVTLVLGTQKLLHHKGCALKLWPRQIPWMCSSTSLKTGCCIYSLFVRKDWTCKDFNLNAGFGVWRAPFCLALFYSSPAKVPIVVCSDNQNM